jgi:integrase
VASFYERGDSPYYWVRVLRPDGTWASEKSKIRKDAQNAARKIRAYVAQMTIREMGMAEGRGSWDWVPSFLRRHCANERTLTRYLNAWSALEVYLRAKGIRGTAEVTYKHCVDYPAWRASVDRRIMRPCNWNTALTEVKVLSVILQEAVRREMIAANPCTRLGLKRRNVRKKPEIQPEEQRVIEEALKTGPPWMRDCWLIAMRQGMRLSETAVPLDRIDLRLMTVSTLGKGGKVHTAPLHEDLVPLVKRALAEKRATLVNLPKYAAKKWHQWFAKLKMKHLSFHSTRVTVVTRLARANYSRQLTKAYVGHASDTVHDIYTRLEAADVRHLGKVLSAAAGSLSGENQDDSEANRAPTPRLRRPRASESQRTSSV